MNRPPLLLCQMNRAALREQLFQALHAVRCNPTVANRARVTQIQRRLKVTTH